MQDPRKSIWISILNQGEVRIELAQLAHFWQNDPRFRVYVEYPSDKPIAHNRGNIVKRFLESGYDYLLMFDGDIIPSAKVLEYALHDKDIITPVLYAFRTAGITPLVLETHPKYPDKYRVKNIKNPTGIVEVDATGTGCMMIKREVLEQVKQPFINRYDDEGIRTLGLDIWFCRKAKELGFKVWVDLDERASHWTIVDLKDVEGLVYSDVLETKPTPNSYRNMFRGSEETLSGGYLLERA